MWLRKFHSTLTKILYEFPSAKTTRSKPNSNPLRANSCALASDRVFPGCAMRDFSGRRANAHCLPLLYDSRNRDMALEVRRRHLSRCRQKAFPVCKMPCVKQNTGSPAGVPLVPRDLPCHRTSSGVVVAHIVSDCLNTQNHVRSILTYTIYCGTIHHVIDSLCAPHFEGRSTACER